MACDAADSGLETSDTSMRCSSRSRVFSIICGVPSISAAWFSISWCRSEGMGKPPTVFQQMQRFKSLDQAQHFLSAHAFIHEDFHPRRHLMAATAYRSFRTRTFNVWRLETCVRHTA